MAKVKLWISDIDGTLMNYDGSVTEKMKELIKKINSSSAKLVLATGRMFMGARHAQKRFNLSGPVVCYQGAVVRDEEKILWQSPIKNELVPEIIDYLRKKKIHTHLYCFDTLYIEDDDKRIMSEYCDGRGTTYKVVNFDEIQYKDVPKILAVIENKDLMKEVKKELSEKYKGILTIVQSSLKYLEITDLHASKGEALKFLKKYWNLSDCEVIASGDQDNDIEMLKEAHYKVCVGNNSKGLYDIANYHSKSVDSNELVDIVEGLI
ncbi:MAG: HAD family hydrolase [Candidatus Gastranaerophilales bacterium]|nr:HAD family hydrolase [Candidatus Gastranaerophilales bacterium]